jgi:hypothetical protein
MEDDVVSRSSYAVIVPAAISMASLGCNVLLGLEEPDLAGVGGDSGGTLSNGGATNGGGGVGGAGGVGAVTNLSRSPLEKT